MSDKNIGRIIFGFLEVLKKVEFSKLTRKQTVSVFRMVATFLFIIVIISIIGLDTILSLFKGASPNEKNDSILFDSTSIPRIEIKTSGENSPAVYSQDEVNIDYNNIVRDSVSNDTISK